MWWSTLGNLLWTFVLFPIVWILEHIVALLVIIFAPLLHILQYALHAALIPFRFLAKFETLYIFFGTAVLLGLLTGVILFFAAHIVGPVVGIRRTSDEPPRTVASYRAERADLQARKARERTSHGLGLPSSSMKSFKADNSDWISHQNPGPPTPMMGTMIMEEPSSSE